MIRNIVVAASLAALSLTTGACNTVQGLGRDIESVGRTGEEVISQAPSEQGERDAQAAR